MEVVGMGRPWGLERRGMGGGMEEVGMGRPWEMVEEGKRWDWRRVVVVCSWSSTSSGFGHCSPLSP